MGREELALLERVEQFGVGRGMSASAARSVGHAAVAGAEYPVS